MRVDFLKLQKIHPSIKELVLIKVHIDSALKSSFRHLSTARESEACFSGRRTVSSGDEIRELTER